MRTREEIEDAVEIGKSGSMTYYQMNGGDKLLLELLIDIRDLLTTHND